MFYYLQTNESYEAYPNLQRTTNHQNMNKLTDSNITLRQNLKNDWSAGILTQKLALYEAPIGAPVPSALEADQSMATVWCP